MPTLKAVILTGKEKKNGESNIKICICHHGKPDYIKTDYYVQSDFFDNDKGVVKRKHPNAAFMNLKLSSKINEYQTKLLKIDEQVLKRLSVQQIKKHLKGELFLDCDFFQYVTHRCQQLRIDGREGTAKSYEDSAKRLKEFIKCEILPFNEFDKKLLDAFVFFKQKEISYTKSKGKKVGKSANSIAIYLRSLKALFKDAEEELNVDGFEPLIKNNPFKGYKIKGGITKDRSIDIKHMKAIKNIKLDGPQAIARDIAMLAFYFIGVNIKDLFYCRGLVKGRFEYERFKGDKCYSIKAEPEALEIIERYKGEKYLLCFADNCAEEREPGVLKPHERKLYQYVDHLNFIKFLNNNLEDIAKKVGIKEKITTYYLRYSWGNIAREICHISMDDISECYGHQKQDLKITGVYVRQRLERIDRNNRKVLDALKSQESKNEFVYEI